jgi:hypothetical protein
VIRGSFVCQVDGAAAPQDLARLRSQQRYRDTLYSLLKSEQRAVVSTGIVSIECVCGRWSKFAVQRLRRDNDM